MSQIKGGLQARDIRFREVNMVKGKIIVVAEDEVEVASVISKFPGVEFSSVVDRIAADFEQAVDSIVAVGRKIIFPNETFKVSVNVEQKTSFTAADLQTVASSRLVTELASSGCRIDETSPLKTIHVNAEEDKVYVFNLKYEGSGGVPLGLSGRALCPELGEESSVLANWLAVRSGFTPAFLLFDLTTYTPHKQLLSAAESVLSILRKTPLQRTLLHVVSVGEDLARLTKQNRSESSAIERLLLADVAARFAQKLNCDVTVQPVGLDENPLWLSRALSELYSRMKIESFNPGPALTNKEIREGLVEAELPQSSKQGKWLTTVKRKYSATHLVKLSSSLDLRSVSNRIIRRKCRSMGLDQKTDTHSIVDALR